MKKSIDIIILCALKNEYRAAAKFILDEEYRNVCIVEGYICTEGKINNSRCLIILMGDGEKKSKLCFQKVLGIFKPCMVVVFGAAGAINPCLKPGVVTIPSILVNYRLPQMELDGNELNNKVIEFVDLHCMNKVVITKAGTTKKFICSKKIKESIFYKLQLDTTDCETYHIAFICEEMGIKFIAFRCITDNADNMALFQYLYKAGEILNAGAYIVKEIISNKLICEQKIFMV